MVEVLIAGMQLWSDVSQMSFNHIVGPKVFIEQEVPALTRVVNGQTEHVRMDLVFNLNGSVTYLDVSIVALFSCNPSLVSSASTKPGHVAKRAEKTKFDRYPHINLVPFILETQVGLAHMPGNSLATSCEMPKVCSKAPSPNNSQPPLRDP